MGDANHNAKLFRQLTALVRGSRTFAHRNRPLYWHEVRRLETLGFRYLSQAYGNGSPYGATFRRFIEEAFLPLYVFGPNRDGFVEKEGFELLEKDPERIYYLDKLSFRHALQILVEAAHGVRTEVQHEDSTSSPSDATIATIQRPSESRAAGPAQPATANTEPKAPRTTVDAFIQKVLSETGRKITRKDIYTTAGYKDRTEFERFQRGDVRTTKTAAAAFQKILNLNPQDFIQRIDRAKTPPK